MTRLICTNVDERTRNVTFREMHHPVTRGPVDYTFPVGTVRNFTTGLVWEFQDTLGLEVQAIRHTLAMLFGDDPEIPVGATFREPEEAGQIIDL